MYRKFQSLEHFQNENDTLRLLFFYISWNIGILKSSNRKAIYVFSWYNRGIKIHKMFFLFLALLDDYTQIATSYCLIEKILDYWNWYYYCYNLYYIFVCGFKRKYGTFYEIIQIKIKVNVKESFNIALNIILILIQ